MAYKPVKVPERRISSNDVVSFNGGLDERGEANAAPNTFTFGRNTMVDLQGLVTHRQGKKRWLPDTVETCYQIFPAIYDDHLYYLVADDGKIKYCEAGDTVWTDCGGNNTVTTGPGIINTFLRVLDRVLVYNGIDKLRFINLANLQMVKYLPVTDPANAPTATATGITASGSFKVYYAISFNSSVGTTKISPILSQAVSKARGSWKTDGTEYLTIARNNTTPTNATSWNLYIATDAAGGTIAASDMMLIASGLDLSVTSFMDTGTISINISQGTAPEDNSTDGPIVQYGVESEGRPILWGDPNNPYNLYIGGDGANALDFSPTNGGYTLPLNKGTNYYPMSTVGFRNGQGIPSLTVLFSNTMGLSKQSIIEQQTVTYGNFSFVVWGVTEQNYGSAGVSSPYSVVNYLGKLIFPTADGIVAMDTAASLQNVLSSERISNPISETVDTFRNSSLKYIVGTAWNNRVYMTVPSRGYSYNNEIIVYDMTNKEHPIWYKWDIKCQWIGVVSPLDSASFVYICQDNYIFRLQTAYVAQDDTSDGLSEAFPLSARGTLLGTNAAHNNFTAINRAVFYLQDAIGDIEIGVTYRDRNGKLKTKSRVVTQGGYNTSHSGNWSDHSYLFTGQTIYKRWSDTPYIEDADTSNKETIREALKLNNVIASEAQWFINTNLDNSSFTLRSVSYEGVNIGIKADLH